MIKVKNEKFLLIDKVNELIASKQQELNVKVIESLIDEKNNAQILAKRASDNQYVVWSSYYTGEISTSYKDFYSGSYNLTLEQGVKELIRRTKNNELSESDTENIE